MHLPASSERTHPTLRLNDLDGREWVQSTKTVMFQQGLGSSHPETRIEKKHPAPFSYRNAEKLIRFFSKKGEAVLDPFCGVGSTLKACALSGRKGTGIELNKTFCRLSKDRVAEEVDSAKARSQQTVFCGDARSVVEKLDDDAYSFILTSPPYWSILAKPDHETTRFRKGSVPYGTDKRDFGCIEDYDDFVESLAGFLDSLKRVLQPHRYMAVMVSDFRHRQTLYALQADLIAAMRKLNRTGERRLVLQGIKIVAQTHKKLFPYGFPTTYVPNIHHHYILVFRNVVASRPNIAPNRRKGGTSASSGSPKSKTAAVRKTLTRKRPTSATSGSSRSKGRRHPKKSAKVRARR